MIIKIATVNDSHTALITQCVPAEGRYGPQVCFTFSNGDQFYMPTKSATIQLIRCGFGDGNKPDEKIDFPAVAGHLLFFSRTANKSTPDASPYYNIDIATGSPPAPSKRLTEVPGVAPKAQTPASRSTTTSAMARQVAAPTRSRAQVAAAYAWCLTTAHTAQTAAFGASPKPTPDSIQAGAATLLIELDKSGLIWQPLALATVVQALDLTPPSRYEEPLPPEPDDLLPF